MSNVIPYFVLAVVALGFFAICYAVFSRGDGESQSKPKTHRNSHVDNNIEAKMIVQLQRNLSMVM